MKTRFLHNSSFVFLSALVLFNLGCKLKDTTVVDPSSLLQDIPSISNLQYTNALVNTDTIFVNGSQNTEDGISLKSIITVRCPKTKNDFAFTVDIKDLSNGQIIATANLFGADSIYTGTISYSIKRSFFGKLQIRVTGISNSVTLNSLTSEISIIRNNKPPVISSVSVPDTVVLGASLLALQITLNAKDDDGLSDINKVQLSSFRLPDTTTIRGTFELYDDGGKNKASGNTDMLPGDGIYTLSIQLLPTTIKATYRFVFQAFDKSNSLSNKITHDIVIK